MEHCLLDDAASLEMLDHYPLEKLGRHACVPDTFGIDHDYRAALADSETWSLAALDAIGSEEQILALKKRGQQAVK